MVRVSFKAEYARKAEEVFSLFEYFGSLLRFDLSALLSPQSKGKLFI